MIHAINISRPHSQRCQSGRHRLSRHNHDMRQMPLSVSNQSQSLRPAILRPVAAHCPFCRNGCMQDRQSSVAFPDIGKLANRIVHKNFPRINRLVRFRVTKNHHVRCHHIIISHTCGKTHVLMCQPSQILQMVRSDLVDVFSFPDGQTGVVASVGEKLYDLMGANGWEFVDEWAQGANKIAPTLVGGSKKHGGPDLGPTRARRAWAELGVDGRGIANAAPEAGFAGMPRLTARMLARLQGFPDEWDFGSRKTVACRMIGNAFPPPVAMCVGLQIKKVLDYERDYSRSEKKISSRVAV